MSTQRAASAAPFPREILSVLLVLLVLPAALSGCRTIDESIAAEPVLFPEIEPLESGHLRVSDTHEIYWETCGDRDGIPVIVLHGGPGGGCWPQMRRFFDPERFFVVLHDQRGAGRSRPRAEWRENTTPHLVADIDRLRAHLGIEGPAILWGGSWGSTLALAYAEARPELVGGLVLRGVFLGTRAEIDHFYHGGTALLFPDTYERLQRAVPQPERLDYPRQLFELTQGDDVATAERVIHEWAFYEARMSRVGYTDEEVEAMIERWDPTAFSVLENHYMMNGCFLEEDQLVRDAHRIAHVPTFIVNGRFDIICPPANAWRLARELDEVRIEFSPASGHSGGEAANTAALLRGTAWVADRFAGPEGS